MCCEVYAEKKGVRVRLVNVFFSFGVDRRYADESTAIGETILCMNHIKNQLEETKGGGEVFVVATDSIRIHIEAKMVQQFEDSLHFIHPNAKLRFIDTWGLVDLEGGEETNFAVAQAVEDREGYIEMLGKHSTKNNPDKSIVVSGPDQQTQNDIKTRGRVIQKIYKDESKCNPKTYIKKTMDLGENLMNYLSNTKVDIIIQHKKKTVTLLKMFCEKWNSLAMEEDSVKVAKEFQQFYLENDAHMQDFLRRDDLPEIFDVNYVRTSKIEKTQPPDYQIGINFAAAELDNNKNRPNITIYDSGKLRGDIGNPGFVAIMVLICTRRVGCTVMLNPARASSEPTEALIMMDLFKLCSRSKDLKQLFSECIGKDAKHLVRAEHARKKLYKEIHNTYDREIRELENKLVLDIIRFYTKK